MWLLKGIGWLFLIWFVPAQIYSEKAHRAALWRMNHHGNNDPISAQLRSEFIFRGIMLRLATVAFTVFLVWLLLR
jgi:hypothetical protein